MENTMQRNPLASAAANYPYLQGLWTIPMGFLILFTGLSNLQERPAGPVLLAIFGGAVLLSWLASRGIARYYREHYGEVKPTRRRKVRYAIALGAWVAVLFVAGSKFLFWSLDSPMCVYASAFALATLAYYAISVGLRAHHFMIWGSIFVAGLLPIWGGVGPDRDALAMFPLGLALIVSGIFDQRLLARTFRSSRNLELENSGAPG
jgi:hypothetical protein